LACNHVGHLRARSAFLRLLAHVLDLTELARFGIACTGYGGVVADPNVAAGSVGFGFACSL
jgi:hypothetical protein